MTVDSRLTRRPFLDVVTHVSEIVCLEPSRTQVHALLLSIRTPRVTLLPPHRPPESTRVAHHDIGEPGL
jgi:hypothetical protein